MANEFDRNKYKETFEKRFGSGSYESGLSNARNLGQLKVEADFQKKEYERRKKEAQKEADKLKKEQEKKEKKDKETSAIDKLVEEKKKSNSQDKNKKKDSGVLNSVGNLLSDFGNASKRAIKAANPFDDVSYGEALLKSAAEFDKEKSKEFDAVDRFSERTVNSATLGLKGNIDKKIIGETPDYLTPRKLGEGGGTDVLSDLLGYAVPGVGIAKALRGTKLGAKGIDDLLGKSLTKSTAKKIAGQTAKEGAAVGAIMSGAEIAGREALNPDDYNWKQNLGQFGLEVGAGAVLDPLVTLGAGKLLSKFKKPPKGGDGASSGGNGTSSEPKSIFDDVDLIKEEELPFTFPEELRVQPQKKRPDLDTLMRAYRGEDVGSTPLNRVNQPAGQQVKSAGNEAIRPVEPVGGGTATATRSLDSVVDEPKTAIDYTEGIEPTLLRDITGLKGASNDVYRIFDSVFGKNSNVTNKVLGELDASKSRYVDMQESYLKELDEHIVKGLGIKKGSKLSKYVQDYGEGNMELAQLQEKAPKDWEKVVDADKWFRAKYDELIDQVNATQAMIYPGNPSKLVPKRNDYYRHFRELQGISGLRSIFDSPSAINPHLAGVSDFTKPGQKWQSFKQKRGSGPYKSDAVGGFLDYIPAASYSTHIDPNIKNIRNLRSELADKTEDSRNLNHFIEYLNDYSNDLAGKSNPILDRFVQKYIPGGRTTMAALNWLNTRVKTNTILGNLGSTLAQLANIPNGVAFAKQHSVKGVGRSMRSILDNSEPIHQSPFIKERYSDAMYRKFDQKWIEQPQKAAEWLLETSDRIGTSFVWNSAYEKGLKESVSNPIKYADGHTRRLLAGRGVGEVPLAQKSKVVQMIMPFTLEVGNLWRVMNDMRLAKDFGGLATLFTANFLLNKVMEEARGSGVTFDPIDAIIDASEPNLNVLERGGRIAGEALSNFPAGSILAGAYPENGVVAGLQLPSRKKLFGDNDPQRFGTGLVSLEAAKNPLFKLIPPFGGNQLKKTLEGIEVINNEGSYKDGKGILNSLPFMGDTNELKFPSENSGEDILKSLLFGPNATDNAQHYFDNRLRPLSEKQTADYQEARDRGVGMEYYDLLMNKRRENTVRSKLKEIQEDETLTDKERMKKIEDTLKLLQLK